MKQAKIKLPLIFIALLFLNTVCIQAQDSTNIHIIPKPLELIEGKGHFNLSAATVLYFENSVEATETLQQRYAEELQSITGFALESSKTKQFSNVISIAQSSRLEKEAYVLAVDAKSIKIKAGSPAGAFYALQTLKQLVATDFLEKKSVTDIVCSIPAVTIKDKPEFGWRGYMLDVSRHFFGPDKIKEVLDLMATLKLNRFHWHLADDQGWRVEIKKYPRLTSVGAWRVNYVNFDENVNNWWGQPVQEENEKATYGGFYTQKEIAEIIAYAKARYIEVLPEIDVPGHSQEILAAYPNISCDDGEYTVATGGVYKDNALCASKEETYAFLEDVLGEVMDLFPFEYIHIGGDECNKEGWKNHELCQNLIKEKGLKDEHGLQSHFIGRVEKMINAKGKNMIGWDEILEGGLAPNATVMSWRGEKGGIKAAKAKHDVIMTPSFANYLDLKQGQSDNEPNLGYSEALLSTSYNYSIVPKELSKQEAKYILGTQGNLWTESISDWGKLTYMTFPRLFAVAENAWTPEENQNFGDFINRLEPQLKRLKSQNIRYANSVFNPWIHQKGNGETMEISLSSELPNPEIRYTLDGSNPTSTSKKYQVPFTIDKTTTIKSGIFKGDKMRGNITDVTYPIHKAAGAKVIYHSKYLPQYKAAEAFALTDLNYGQLLANGDQNWQGFNEDLDVELVLEKPTDISSVHIQSLKKSINGIYPPRHIEVYGSVDGVTYKKIGDSGFIKSSLIQGRNKVKTEIVCKGKDIQSLRIKAYAVRPIPNGHHKAGEKSVLLIDEIMVF